MGLVVVGVVIRPQALTLMVVRIVDGVVMRNACEDKSTLSKAKMSRGKSTDNDVFLVYGNTIICPVVHQVGVKMERHGSTYFGAHGVKFRE